MFIYVVLVLTLLLAPELGKCHSFISYLLNISERIHDGFMSSTNNR